MITRYTFRVKARNKCFHGRLSFAGTLSHPPCSCRRRRRCTQKEGASSSPATPLDVGPALQLEGARKEVVEVSNQEMGGKGARATLRDVSPRVMIEHEREEEIEVTS